MQCGFGELSSNIQTSHEDVTHLTFHLVGQMVYITSCHQVISCEYILSSARLSSCIAALSNILWVPILYLLAMKLPCRLNHWWALLFWHSDVTPSTKFSFDILGWNQCILRSPQIYSSKIKTFWWTLDLIQISNISWYESHTKFWNLSWETVVQTSFHKLFFF